MKKSKEKTETLAPIRRLEVTEKVLFLTFDDGPDPECTPQVLDLLAEHRAKATFFVVGEKALQHRTLLDRILREGHSVGDHSWDHLYRWYFSPKEELREWILHSQENLRDLVNRTPVGFRSPAGVITPPLRNILQGEGIPLILWNTRFYDAVFPWRTPRALGSLRNTRRGSVVLLHDRQRDESRRKEFLATLNAYLGSARHEFEFKFQPLPWRP